MGKRTRTPAVRRDPTLDADPETTFEVRSYGLACRTGAPDYKSSCSVRRFKDEAEAVAFAEQQAWALGGPRVYLVRVVETSLHFNTHTCPRCGGPSASEETQLCVAAANGRGCTYRSAFE